MSHLVNKVNELLSRPVTIRVLAILIAVASSVFASYFTSKAVVFNPDATANIFMFQEPFRFHDFLLADWHTSILKFPIIFIQALLPFNMYSFTVWVSLTFLATIVLWAHAVSLLFGKRYFAWTLIIMSILLAISLRFSIEISLITIRNLEYPIFLYLLIWFWKLIPTFPKKQKLPQYIAFVIAAALLPASDPFFLYAWGPAVLCTLLIYFYKKRSAKTYLLASGFAIVPLLLSKVILLGLKAIGFYHSSFVPLSPPTYDFFSIQSAFWQASYDTIILFNADIFKQQIGIQFIISGVCLAFLVFSIVLFFKHLRRIADIARQNPVFATLLLTTVIIFVIYLLTFANSRSFRYISIIAFVLPVIFLIYIDKTFKRPAFVSAKALRNITLLTIAVVTPLAMLYYAHQYRKPGFFSYGEHKDATLRIVNSLENRGIDGVMTDYLYAMPIQFWSDSKIRGISINYCREDLSFLVRKSWYQPARYSKVAILVDRSFNKVTTDDTSNDCASQSIIKRYGDPLETYRLSGYDNAPVDIYVYPSSALTKTVPIK